jgi:hypothetical protein
MAPRCRAQMPGSAEPHPSCRPPPPPSPPPLDVSGTPKHACRRRRTSSTRAPAGGPACPAARNATRSYAHSHVFSPPAVDHSVPTVRAHPPGGSPGSPPSYRPRTRSDCAATVVATADRCPRAWTLVSASSAIARAAAASVRPQEAQHVAPPQQRPTTVASVQWLRAQLRQCYTVELEAGPLQGMRARACERDRERERESVCVRVNIREGGHRCRAYRQGRVGGQGGAQLDGGARGWPRDRPPHRLLLHRCAALPLVALSPLFLLLLLLVHHKAEAKSHRDGPRPPTPTSDRHSLRGRRLCRRFFPPKHKPLHGGGGGAAAGPGGGRRRRCGRRHGRVHCCTPPSLSLSHTHTHSSPRPGRSGAGGRAALLIVAVRAAAQAKL